jgi:hypothetical protein
MGLTSARSSAFCEVPDGGSASQLRRFFDALGLGLDSNQLVRRWWREQRAWGAAGRRRLLVGPTPRHNGIIGRPRSHGGQTPDRARS